MKDITRRPLFIFEMANNHVGSVEHGGRIVRELREAWREFPFNFAVKLQYRDIDTFIHPHFEGVRLEVREALFRTRAELGAYMTIKAGHRRSWIYLDLHALGRDLRRPHRGTWVRFHQAGELLL